MLLNCKPRQNKPLQPNYVYMGVASCTKAACVHKAMGIYMGVLTLDANTLLVDICFFKPYLHT